MGYIVGGWGSVSRIVVAITGSGGAIYGKRLLKGLIISLAGRLVMGEELGVAPEEIERLAVRPMT